MNDLTLRPLERFRAWAHDPYCPTFTLSGKDIAEMSPEDVAALNTMLAEDHRSWEYALTADARGYIFRTKEPMRVQGGWDFGSAIAALKRGARVQRAGWNGKGMWLMLQTPTTSSKMTLPYIYMSTAQGDLVPWLASQTDVLAEDWALV